MMGNLETGSRLGPYPYRIERRLGAGRGNMAEVYLATVQAPRRLVHPVAVKIARLADEHGHFNEEGLRNEVDLLPALIHPAIVQIFPIEFSGGKGSAGAAFAATSGRRNAGYRARTATGGQPWFAVLEYLAGGTLAELLTHQMQPLSLDLVLGIGYQLAEALDYLHRSGVVHMDVKPDNIMLRYDPRQRLPVQPVFVDFGVARRIGQETLGGTEPYMAPERVHGELAADPKMDIFALGLVLYRLLVGRLPYTFLEGDPLRAEILAGVTQPPSTLRQDALGSLVAEYLDTPVLAMLHRDPAQRPTALDVALALQSVAQELGQSPALHLTGPILPPDSLPAGADAPAAAPAVAPTDSSAALGTLWRRWWPAVAGAGAALVMVALLAGTCALLPSCSLALPAGAATQTTALVAAATPSPPTATAVATIAATSTPIKPARASVAALSAAVSSPTTQPTEATRPTPASTQTPTNTPAPTSTDTPTSTPTLTNTPTPADAATSGSTPLRPTYADLLSPGNGATITESTTFTWRPNRPLPANQAYELIVWEPEYGDYNKLEQGRNTTAATRDTAVTIDLKALIQDGTLNKGYTRNLPLNKPIKWSVRLIQVTPYQRLAVLNDGAFITVQ